MPKNVVQFNLLLTFRKRKEAEIQQFKQSSGALKKSGRQKINFSKELDS